LALAVRCTVDGTRVASSLKRYETTKDRQLKAQLKKCADEIKRDIVRKTHVKTGRLRRSFRVVPLNGGYTQVIGSTLFYLHLVSDNTDAHDIKPVKKKFLAWGGYVGTGEFTNKKGNIVRRRMYVNFHGQLTLSRADKAQQNFARKVHSPGHEGDKFFESTLTEDRQEILQALYQVLKART
jgi:hypothetical protein